MWNLSTLQGFIIALRLDVCHMSAAFIAIGAVSPLSSAQTGQRSVDAFVYTLLK